MSGYGYSFDDPTLMAFPLGGDDYWKSILALSPLAYWRLNERSGIVAADSSGKGFDGVATGVTWGQPGIGDGDTAAGFDGVNDIVDVYSTGLRDVFNGAVGTLAAWGKINAWNDGSSRFLIQLHTSTGDQVYVYKVGSTGKLSWLYDAGGVFTGYQYLPSAGEKAAWFSVAITWEASADEVKPYFNGRLLSTRTGLGTWSGLLDSGFCNIGAVAPGVVVWDGDVAHSAVWDRVLTEREIAQLGVVT